MSVAPKRPKGPPLNALRAFEAAARHGSFALAAEELNVTPGAISQHIKALEGWTGTELFRRNAQGVELTRQAQALAAGFTKAFDVLADATRALHNCRPDADFHIAALPAVAQLWLPRRLRTIRARFPDINFSVTAMETPPSLARELFDLAIFLGVPDGSSAQVIVGADELVPVCAPDIVARTSDFDRVTRLHDQAWLEDWPVWCAAHGVRLTSPKTGPHFSLYSLAVEEAKAGAGVLMGHVSLVEDALATGALMRADDRTCQTGRALIIDMPDVSACRAETPEIVDLLRA